MSADRIIDLTRALRRAAETFGREMSLTAGSSPLSAGTLGSPTTVVDQFMAGYDGAETTLPFISDVSVEGGDDIVTG